MPTSPTAVAESVRAVRRDRRGRPVDRGFDRRSPPVPLYDFDLALARVRAARAAIDSAGGDVVFTARSEGFIRGRPDLEETIRRLKAFAAAGADCLYAPGIKAREQIEAVVQAVAPKPVNLLVSGAGLTVSDIAAHGRAPHQRRRHRSRASPGTRLHPLGARDRRGGQVRQLRRDRRRTPTSTRFFRDDAKSQRR